MAQEATHKISEKDIVGLVEASRSNLHRDLWIAQKNVAKKQFGSDGNSHIDLVIATPDLSDQLQQFDGHLNDSGILSIKTNFMHFREVVKDQSGMELYTIVDELKLSIRVHYIWDHIDKKFIFTVLKTSSVSKTYRLVPQGGSREGGSSTGGKTLW
jgi:hypothetical protein